MYLQEQSPIKVEEVEAFPFQGLAAGKWIYKLMNNDMSTFGQKMPSVLTKPKTRPLEGKKDISNRKKKLLSKHNKFLYRGHAAYVTTYRYQQLHTYTPTKAGYLDRK